MYTNEVRAELALAMISECAKHDTGWLCVIDEPACLAHPEAAEAARQFDMVSRHALAVLWRMCVRAGVPLLRRNTRN